MINLFKKKTLITLISIRGSDKLISISWPLGMNKEGMIYPLKKYKKYEEMQTEPEKKENHK